MPNLNISALHELKGLLTQQRQFYRNRLVGNWGQQADRSRELSLSFLEGEARAYHQALLRVEQALSILTEILEVAENARE